MTYGTRGPLRRPSPPEREDLAKKCWMTHDAMWFFHCAQECGIEKANRINKAAVRSMAAIEIKRIAKILAVDTVKTFQDLRVLLEGAEDLIKAGFMDFSWTVPSENLMRWDMHSCFAYDGVKKIGYIDRYQCGIFDRVEGWFDGIGVKYTVTPHVTGCMMHTEGKCFREFTFDFHRAGESGDST